MQRFATSGVVRYEVTRGFGSTRSFDEEEGVFKIEVVEVPPGSKPSQHGVTIRLAEGRLQADPPTIEINAGDMVLWNSGLAEVPGFSVRGEGAGMSFDSAAMTGECIFSHPFGLPGRYSWTDANGSDLVGNVVVRPHEARGQKPAQLRSHLEKGTVVAIKGQDADPEAVDILVGQTVFWLVERAPGITITDARLHQGPRPDRR